MPALSDSASGISADVRDSNNAIEDFRDPSGMFAMSRPFCSQATFQLVLIFITLQAVYGWQKPSLQHFASADGTLIVLGCNLHGTLLAGHLMATWQELNR